MDLNPYNMNIEVSTLDDSTHTPENKSFFPKAGIVTQKTDRLQAK